jgi:hypothetical protein
MSNFEAIGGVSHTLKTLLLDRMELPPSMTLPTLTVTVDTPPPDPDDADGPETSRVNLFLYRVTENGALKNQEIPGRGQPGAYGHPPLSLNLHYLLTAYGTMSDAADTVSQVRAHFLLGSAMRVFHDFPTVTSALLRVRDQIGTPVLHPSLQQEFEQVKLTLDPLSLEDMSKVWTALTLRYRLSAAYTVSVVQIESRRVRRPVKLVGEPPLAGPRVHITTLRHPRIDDLFVRRPADPPGTERRVSYVRVGDRLIVRGSGFGTEPARLQIESLAIPILPADDRIEVVVPDAAMPDGSPIPQGVRLQPGALSVGVVLPVASLPSTGFPSNRTIAMLVPRVDAATLVAGAPRRVRIDGSRLFSDRLTGETIIGPEMMPKSAYLTSTDAQIVVPLSEALPFKSVPCLVSAPITAAINIPQDAQVSITIGADGPRTATFATAATTLVDAASQLQAAIRRVPGTASDLFRAAHVLLVGDRLVVVPGQLAGQPTVAVGPAADQLRLSAATGARNAVGRLSGQLDPFPGVTAAAPALRVSVGANAQVVTIPVRPSSLPEAATLLQTAIRAASGTPDFQQAMVILLRAQLLVLPGSGGPLDVDAVPGGDQTTVDELRFRGRFAVRVRVNGAESLDQFVVSLP